MQDWLPTEPWLAASAPLTSGSACRSAGLTDQVAQQFEVATHPRYQPRDVGGGPTTFCNIFLSDVTKALGCPIPHVDLLARGGWGELDANATCRWLMAAGPRHGWGPISRDYVVGRVDEGAIVVAAWLHQGGIGHVALVVPAHGTGQLLVSQAGARCFEREPLAHGFGTYVPAFYIHN